MDFASFRQSSMNYKMYMGDAEWRKLRTVPALKRSEIEGNSLPKGRLIPHKIVASHEVAIKGAIRYEMGPRRIS